MDEPNVLLLDEPTNDLDIDTLAAAGGPAGRLAGHPRGGQPRPVPDRPGVRHGGRTARRRPADRPARRDRAVRRRAARPADGSLGRARTGRTVRVDCEFRRGRAAHRPQGGRPAGAADRRARTARVAAAQRPRRGRHRRRPDCWRWTRNCARWSPSAPRPSRTGWPPRRPPRAAEPGGSTARRLGAMSRFVDQLIRAGADSPCGITTGEPGAPVRRSWPEVHATARRMAADLQRDGGPAGGLGPGAPVALLAGQPAEIAPAAQAVWLAGGSVTMLHQPTARTDLAAWAEDTVRVLEMIGARLVLLGAAVRPGGRGAHRAGDRGTADRRARRAALRRAAARQVRDAAEDDVALLQLTSGSTAHPKAVRITHGNLWANATAMLAASALEPGADVMVSWLPLFHDMGMVGFLTLPMMFGHRAGHGHPGGLPVPAAALGGADQPVPRHGDGRAELRLRRAGPPAGPGRRRVRWTCPACGSRSTARSRSTRRRWRRSPTAGARFGLRAESVVAAYGMAETVLGVSLRPAGHRAAGRRDRRRPARARPPGGAGRGRRGAPGAPVPAARPAAAGHRGAGGGRRRPGARRPRGRRHPAARSRGDRRLPHRRRPGVHTGRRGLAGHRRRGVPGRTARWWSAAVART